MSTFSQLKFNVNMELGLDPTASGNEDTLLGRRINQAVLEVLKKTHVRVISANTTLTANQGDYDLDDEILVLKSIKNSQNTPLERVSPEEIHDLRRSSAATGSDVWKYAVDGANLLMIYPTPTTGGTLTMYYVQKPTEMSGASDDPSSATYGGIPVQFHDLIEYWVCYRMAMFDDDQSSQGGATYKQLFDNGCLDARKEIRRMGGRKLGPIRMGMRKWISRDPSTT